MLKCGCVAPHHPVVIHFNYHLDASLTGERLVARNDGLNERPQVGVLKLHPLGAGKGVEREKVIDDLRNPVELSHDFKKRVAKRGRLAFIKKRHLG